MTNDKIRLSDTSRELKVPYQRIYEGVVEGWIPAERNDNGTRWIIRRKDLPAIAGVLGVEVPAVNAA